MAVVGQSSLFDPSAFFGSAIRHFPPLFPLSHPWQSCGGGGGEGGGGEGGGGEGGGLGEGGGDLGAFEATQSDVEIPPPQEQQASLAPAPLSQSFLPATRP